jgi:large subunit ribosomal protein L6e
MQHAIGILAVLFFSFHFNVFKLLISQLIRLNCFFYCSGPFKVNGVPIRRVNQTYVIATSTKVDISGVDVSKFDDKYFARDKKTKVKKTEGELFETEKEVGSISLSFQYHLCSNTHPAFNLQAAKSLPDFKKDDQKAVDAALMKAIDAVPDLKTYLGARFSLRDGDKPHEMVF